jgi:hypothetical protein
MFLYLLARTEALLLAVVASERVLNLAVGLAEKVVMELSWPHGQ